MPNPIVPDDESIKVGARNNSGDRGRVRAIRKAAAEIVDHTKAMEPDDEDKEKDPLNCAKPLKADLEALFITLPDIPGAVKALGDWELEVLGVPFGGPDNGRDTDGQYFSPKTNTFKDFFKTIPVFYYHGVNPDGRSAQADPVLIGTAKYERTDTRGHWFRVKLNKAVEFARRMWEAAKRGIARASSGSLSHLVRIDKGGEILSWPVAELSLIDAEGKRQPANSWAVAQPVMKAMYDMANMVIPPDLGDNTTVTGQARGVEDAGYASKRTGTEAAANTIKQGDFTMDEKEVKDLVASAVAEGMKAQALANEQASKAEAERQAAFDAEVAKAVGEKTEAMKAEYVKAGRLPFMDSVTIAKNSDLWKYDGLDAGDQAVMIGVLESAHKPVSPAAIKALATKLDEDKSEAGEIGQRAMKAAGVKANELNYDYTNLGAEWIGIAYSAALWESIRAGTFILGKLPQVEVPQGMESIYLPLEYTDPVWYKVAEATSSASGYSGPTPTVTVSAVGTDRALLTLAKLGARVVWTGELDESSLVPFAGQMRAQLATSGAEYLESAIIDGDTAATTANVNATDGAGCTGVEWYSAFNGFRKSALITTAANSRSAAGSLDVTDYLETVKLMGAGGKNADINKVGFIVDSATYHKTLALPELLTRDVFASPTIEGGQLTGLWGYSLNRSGSMLKNSAKRLTTSAGDISLTDSGNSYGQIVAARWDQWKFGWRRRMTMETTRFANSDTNEIVAMVRCGLIQRDTEASACTYYVGI